MTADSDSRVDPMHALKMAALMQVAGSKRPVLLRVEGKAGHVVGTPVGKRIEEETDIYSFLWWQFGGEVSKSLSDPCAPSKSFL